MRKQFDNSTDANPVAVSKDNEGHYTLRLSGRPGPERYDDVQSVWKALDELDAPRAYAQAA